MSEKKKPDLENEFISLMLSAMKKGMSIEEFFAIADATMNHLRGRIQNETVERIIKNEASSEDVREMIANLIKKD